MEKQIKIIGTKVINNKEIREVEGGFGEGQKCILVSDVAKQHELRLDKLNELIRNNIERFNKNDIIDFLNPSEGLRDFARENGLFTNNRTKNIFLLSERGYTKLVAMMDNTNEKKWEVMDKLIDNYFAMRSELKQQLPQDYLSALKALVASEEEKQLLIEQNNQKEQIINEMKPKVSYYDIILQSDSLVTITTIAKDYGMSGQKMNETLHELGVQYKQGGTWLLYSKYQDQGYTHSKTYSYSKKDGTSGTKMNTQWTQKGRLFLYDLLKKNDILPTIEQ